MNTKSGKDNFKMRNIEKRVGKSGTVSYRIRVYDGYDINGKQIKHNKSWVPEPGMTDLQIEKELTRQQVLFEEKVKMNDISGQKKYKFAEYAEIYMKRSMSPKTREGYNRILENVNKAIGHIWIDKMQSEHLYIFYENLRKVKSQKTGAPMSSRTIHNYHRLIAAILAHATKARIIPRNIASREYMDAPKTLRRKPKFLDDIQARRFMECLQEEDDMRYVMSFTLLMYMGCREGELLGLDWPNFDFNNQIVSIDHETQWVNDGVQYKGIITKPPKTVESERPIKLPPLVFELLYEYKEWQMEMIAEMGDVWPFEIDFVFYEDDRYITRRQKNERLFTALDGGLIHPSTLWRWLNDFTTKYDLPPVSPHSLRHTNITLQIANSVPLSAIAARSGHSRISTLTDVYTHNIRTADEIASQVLDDLLTPKRKHPVKGPIIPFKK